MQVIDHSPKKKARSCDKIIYRVMQSDDGKRIYQHGRCQMGKSLPLHGILMLPGTAE